MGWFSDLTGDALGGISDELAGVDDAVNENIPGGWTTLALLAGGYYYAPEISAYMNAAGSTVPASAVAAESSFVAADAAQLAAQGLSQAQIEATLASTGIDSFIAADAAQLAAQGLSGSQISSTLAAAGSTAAASGGLTAAQMANLAKAGISLAGVAGAANVAGGTGGLGLSQQDRSGFSSGSANYSPEYYQQIQSKYNQYMPQQAGKDITTDLKNWYETKYTPGAGTSTSGTTGTGYTTDQSMTNLNLVKPIVPPVAPLYSSLTAGSSDSAIANAYSQFIAQNGGNTAANRQAANDYLIKLGVPQTQINAAYNTFLSKLPASGNTPSSVAANATPAQIAQAFTAYVQGQGGNTQANRVAAAEYLKSIGVPVSTIEAGYKSYLGTLPASGTTATTLNANATPAQIAAAYASYASGAGGDTAANKQAAIEYLKNIGVSDATIQAAYPIYKSTYGGGGSTGGGGGMLTGGGGGDDYTSLTGGSSAADIAAAYADYVAGAGGDTAANQAAAIDYLSGLGVDQGTINAAYDVYKG